jgi:hypothetical protein
MVICGNLLPFAAKLLVSPAFSWPVFCGEEVFSRANKENNFLFG